MKGREKEREMGNIYKKVEESRAGGRYKSGEKSRTGEKGLGHGELAVANEINK